MKDRFIIVHAVDINELVNIYNKQRGETYVKR